MAAPVLAPAFNWRNLRQLKPAPVGLILRCQPQPFGRLLMTLQRRQICPVQVLGDLPQLLLGVPGIFGSARLDAAFHHRANQTQERVVLRMPW